MAAILVTGGAKGIGQACVLRLAAAGHRVFAGVRNTADGERLRAQGGSNISPVQLEVTSADDIAAAASLIRTEVGPTGLHGLVNNAGIVIAAPLEFVPIDEFRRQLEVNVVGVLAVMQAMLPLLRETRGRIVNISSIAGRSALPMTGPYSASKFALEAMSDSLRIELLEFGIEVVLIEPGVIATPIWETSLQAADRTLARTPQMMQYYGKMIEAVKRRVGGAGTTGMPPDRVARAVEHALFASRPKTRYLIGKDARARLLMQRMLPDRWSDRLIAAALRRM